MLGDACRLTRPWKKERYCYKYIFIVLLQRKLQFRSHYKSYGEVNTVNIVLHTSRHVNEHEMRLNCEALSTSVAEVEVEVEVVGVVVVEA